MLFHLTASQTNKEPHIYTVPCRHFENETSIEDERGFEDIAWKCT